MPFITLVAAAGAVSRSSIGYAVVEPGSRPA